jgi:ApbE superfamily uncharacterized protein (UPF0280 family)
MSHLIYKDKLYRSLIKDDYLKSYQVKVSETDLLIRTDSDLSKIALQSIIKHRNFIEEYIRKTPEYLTSLVPIDEDPNAPVIVRDMLKYSKLAGVGPMASVAGAIAEFVGQDLMNYSETVIVENGGDIFLKVRNEARVGIYAGASPLSMKLRIRINPWDTPLGVCTSSATVGHSLSFGIADAVCVTAKSAVLADATATRIGNRIKRKEDIKIAIEEGLGIQEIKGVMIIVGDTMGAAGDIELCEA